MDNKPCPFCGGTEAELTTQTEDREGIPVSLVCVGCGAYGPWAYARGTPDQLLAVALYQWNNRAT